MAQENEDLSRKELAKLSQEDLISEILKLRSNYKELEKKKQSRKKKQLLEEISTQNQKIQQQLQLITELQSQLAQYQSNDEPDNPKGLVISPPITPTARAEPKRRGSFLSKLSSSGKHKQENEASSPPSVTATSPLSDPTPRKLTISQNVNMDLSDSTDIEEQFREYSGKGNVEEMRKLLKLGVNINAQDDSGYTALHWAAIHGRYQSINLLIKCGADVNQFDHGGWTALHYASFKGHKDCVASLLVVPDIDVQAKNSAKKTASQIATKKEVEALLKFVKTPGLKPMLEQARNVWTEYGKFNGSFNSLDSNGSFNGPSSPDKEQELIQLEKDLFEKEQRVLRMERELHLQEETIKRMQKEEQDKQQALKDKEDKLSTLETDVLKKIQTQGEESLGTGLITITWEEIKPIEEVGSGAFGSVYKAVWRGDLVAAKKIKCNASDTQRVQAFLEETRLLAKMRHPNIVMVMAASCQLPDLVIVTELMKSDLWTLLNNPKEKLEWKQKIDMALDIARGMNFLHNLKPPLVHRDLKSQNVLIDENLRVKISDFGTSVEKNLMGTEIVGTAAWMCPARLLREESDEKTDVFSYGVILWELLNRKIPWEGLSNMQIIARVGHAGERLPLPDSPPKGCPNGFVNLIRDCWETHGVKRPSFEVILQSLRDMQTQIK
mmetsp:Transcript_19776/g.27601  ORF Transcript_19776/g.27601 Transcript_19776/m.27601 type:complete len:666 (+) Transcript_19776:74-2071(+)